MKKNILFAGVLSLLSSSVLAQNATEKNIVLLGLQNMAVSDQDTTFYIPVLTNQELEISKNVDWITTSLEHNRIKVCVSSNPTSEPRVANISVAAQNGAMTRTFTVEQERENLAAYVPKIIVATASASQPGEGIERTLDGDKNTLWHSPYSGGGFPITLTYDFKGVEQIDSIRYVPRPSGTNGNFGQVEVYAKCAGDSDYQLVYSGDWKGESKTQVIPFEQPLLNPQSVQFKVLSGAGNFASCAEMEFYRKETGDLVAKNLFVDDAWDELKPGITQADIDTVSNPYYKYVAQQLLNDRESFIKDRVQSYVCRLSPQTQSSLLNSPGKLYDQLQGVTGININKGLHGIAVSGLPEGKTLTLKVVSWFSQELNEKGVGGGPVEYSYALHNGINSIEYTSDYDGLAYISYYSDEYNSPESPVDHNKYPDIKVHFINGIVNGYLSPDRTNEELDEVLRNAKNRCIDLVGNKVHSIWQTSGMQNYCKDSNGTSKGYVQFMNLLDSLVDWEHELLGLKKYNRVPDNRTMAYVNYTYYMFQGNYGVSFMYDQESRVLNCRTMMYNDADAIWGLSHEWGHQHQMQPYFCWAGLGESSNNMNSCYNVLHMGYQGNQASRIQGNWTSAYNHLFLGQTTIDQDNGKDVVSYQYAGSGNGNYVKNGDTYTAVNQGEGDYVYELQKKGAGAVAESRNRAYDNINAFAWCPKLQEAIRAQREMGFRIPEFTDKEHTVSTNELYVEENTAAFFMLYCYFSNQNHADYVPDFQEDLYESLRQNDEPNGSSIEKQDGADKYELLASAHNSNKEGKYATFKERFPESCWITQNYLKEGGLPWTQNSVPFIFNYIRKASRLCGYNLFDYFDRMGFMRTIVLAIDDYGMKYYAMTEDMKAEFKQDMDELGLKPITEEMMEQIAHSPLPVFQTPNIPNEPVVNE